HQAAIAERGPRDVVTATTDRHRQTVLAREAYAGHDVGAAAHPGNQSRLSRVDRAPDQTSFAVSRTVSWQLRPAQRRAHRREPGRRARAPSSSMRAEAMAHVIARAPIHTRVMVCKSVIT